MAGTHCVLVLGPMALHLEDPALGGAAHESEDAALVDDLRRLVKVAVEEEMQAGREGGAG